MSTRTLTTRKLNGTLMFVQVLAGRLRP